MADNTSEEEKKEAFYRRVRDFVNSYADEYAFSHKTDYFTEDPDDLRARIILNYPNRSQYEVRITTDERGNAAIDIGDAGTMSLDAHGLYAYLFNEADHKHRQLAEQVEALEARPPIRVAPNGAMLASETTGMSCPECEAIGPFNITVTGPVSVDDRGSGSIGFGDMEFDGGADCACEQCGHKGFVREFKPGTLGKYTVVLLYPDYVKGDDDLYTYVQCVETVTPEKAEEEVRAQASKANNAHIRAEDFLVVAVFAGDCPLELNGGGI